MSTTTPPFLPAPVWPSASCVLFLSSDWASLAFFFSACSFAFFASASFFSAVVQILSAFSGLYGLRGPPTTVTVFAGIETVMSEFRGGMRTRIYVKKEKKKKTRADEFMDMCTLQNRAGWNRPGPVRAPLVANARARISSGLFCDIFAGVQPPLARSTHGAAQRAKAEPLKCRNVFWVFWCTCACV